MRTACALPSIPSGSSTSDLKGVGARAGREVDVLGFEAD